MRKIEEAMCAAVKERMDWRGGNTTVKNDGSGFMFVFLYDNLIATISGTVGSFTLAGHNTKTTRSRLAALGVKFDRKVMYRDDSWYNFVAEL